MATSPNPPYYILLSHSKLPSNSAQPTTTNPSSTLVHPTIQYHYADDPPLSLLPSNSSQRVLVMNYDPADPHAPTVQSLSPDLVVAGVKVTEAPGADAPNSNMYVVETIATPQADESAPLEDSMQVASSLTQFKQRNALLRRALDFPGSPAAPDTSPLTVKATLSTTPS